MAQVIKMLSLIVNNIHDLLVDIFAAFGYNLTDKQLHFIIIGIIGMIIFIFADLIFKALAKYSVSIISFIYTSTVLVVIVFAIEIQQKITGRGRMEFSDITAGLWGFLEIFGVYLSIRVIIYLIKLIIKKVQK